MQASSRLGSLCPMALVDSYAPGLLAYVLHLVQEVVFPA